MGFFESYKNTLEKMRFLSKATSFLIAILLFSEIAENIYSYLFQADIEWVNENWNRILISVFFQAFIACVFSLRFVFLWFQKAKYIWLSQTIWAIGWLSIIAYYFSTNLFLYGTFSKSMRSFCIDCYDDFLWASVGLVQILFMYMIFSPIKEILVLASSFGLQKRNAK